MSARKLFADKDKPRIVYSTVSVHSGKINVWKHHQGLILEVGGYSQSVSLDTPSLPERYWFKAADEITRRLGNPKRALIVGVGGATITHLLGRKFPELKFVGVELDPEIVKVARKFFGLDEIKNLSLVVGEGKEYVLEYEGDKFDLTFIDAYLGGNFPLQFEEKQFLRRLRKITDPKGLIAVNRASGFDRPPFETLLNEVFDKVEMIKIPLPGFLGGLGGNLLYLCK